MHMDYTPSQYDPQNSSGYQRILLLILSQNTTVNSMQFQKFKGIGYSNSLTKFCDVY